MEWPESKPRLVLGTMGTVGKDPLAVALAGLNGRMVAEKPVVVRPVRTVEEACEVDCLYVGPSRAAQLPAILGAVSKYPVLTVSDLPGFAEKGGSLGLYRDADRIRFAANLRSLRQSGLKVSSRLLSLAKIVDRDPLRSHIIEVAMDPEAFVRAASATGR
ncbi:YfiR family protein [bacterium CPR1]|nr:YfiR family protein [bacterium CPR1]